MGKTKDLSAHTSKDLFRCDTNRFSKHKHQPRKMILPSSEKFVEYFQVDKTVLQHQIKANTPFDSYRVLEIYSQYAPDDNSSSSTDCSLELSHKKAPLSSSDSDTNKTVLENDNLITTNLHILSHVNIDRQSKSSSESHDSLTQDKTSPHLCENKKNYKSLTRERRVEANARERSRVHTISAAFESLRHAVPGYSNSPKLSKLGILRIACCYIESLNQLLQTSDKIDPQFNSNFSKCIQKLAQTIASESKLKNNASNPH